MSDRPSSQSTHSADDKQPAGVWHQPSTPGNWRAPDVEPEEESFGWRATQTPHELETELTDAGIWHAPGDESTAVQGTPAKAVPAPTAPNETQPAPSTENATASTATPQASTAEAEAPAAAPSELPFDDVPGAASSSVAAAPVEPAALPFDGDTTTPKLAYDEEEDSDTFSMSELMALASLVEDQPAAPGLVQPADSALTAAAPETSQTSAVSATDPAEYARQQLAKLAQQAEEDHPEATTEPAASGLPNNTTPIPTQPAPALDPKTAALAKKFRDTEAQVRALRQQQKSGLITREQLQTELRQLMVLDDDGVWWMLGVETDTWYKYENNQWIAETPPALTEADVADMGAAIQAPTGSGNFDSDMTVATNAINPDDYMPLPRPVPVRDPDYTLPGTAGIYIPPVPTDLGATMPVGATVVSSAVGDATVPVRPVGGFGSGGISVPAAVPATDPTAPPTYSLARPASPAYQDAVKRQQRSTTRTLLIGAGIIVALIFLLGACGIVAGLAYYSSLASPYQTQIAALANYTPQFQTARILDAQGNLIVELTSQQGGARTTVPIKDISPFFIDAVVSTENERYYDDPGWDAIAIARAIIQNATSGDIQSGASTITQQLARNLILQSTDVTTQRKLQEVVIASEIAQKYDKNFILQLYMNEVFFGNQSYGVEAAAEFYFNKKAADLNMAESALLAGMIQAPATYDPVVNSGAAFARMDTVLRRMRQTGCIQFQHEPYLGRPFCIDDSQIRLKADGDIVGGNILIERAVVETTTFKPRTYAVKYPHFVNFVQAQIEQTFGASEMYRRGFTISTTLLPRIQDAAQTALQQQIAATSSTGLDSGAVLVTDPATGAIRAMVGSPDFNDEAHDGQVNNVLTWQQPGSSIKPIVYVGAFEGVNKDNGFQYLTPASILWDVPTTFNTQPPYAPVNYDHLFHGPVGVRYALQNSYNIPAVKALQFIGLDKFKDVAARMGERFLDDATFGLPSALGANEVRLYDHVQAYATLANGGLRVPLYAITGITDASGANVELPPRPQPVQAIQPQVAYMMANILSDNQARAAAFGLNSGLTIPGYDNLVAAKTGTTNDNRDLWTMGFTSNMVVGVWTGRVDNQPTSATTGTAAIPIWHMVMQAALQGTAVQPFADPGGLAAAQICSDTGVIYDQSQKCTSTRSEIFIQSQPPPPANQAFLQQAAVDTWTGLRANQFCSENVESRAFVRIDDPSAVTWLQTADGKAWATQMGFPDDVEALPAQECNASTQLPNIHMNQPVDGQQITGVLQVIGSVVAPNFNRYQLEVASINDPNNFQMVDGPYTTQQQPGALIAKWDTSVVPNGLYRLRLAAFANDGGYVYRIVQIGVNNVLPTQAPIIPTQQIVIPPTVDINATGASPLPFDIQIQPGASPTPEVPGL